VVCPAPGHAGRFRGLFLQTVTPSRLRKTPVRACGTQGVVAARSLGAPQTSRQHPRLNAPVHSRLHACAPHAMDLIGLLHIPGGVASADACPVRAGCCPDMNLGHPPVAPESSPSPLAGSKSRQRKQGRHRCGHRHPFRVTTDVSRRAPHRNGMGIIYFGLSVTSIGRGIDADSFVFC
jgi:hypothetical protein